MSPVYNKGRDWVESITKTHSYLLPEFLRSLQPVLEMAALLLGRKIMQKLGENMTFRESHEQLCCFCCKAWLQSSSFLKTKLLTA
jgi:hypothetical protein